MQERHADVSEPYREIQERGNDILVATQHNQIIEHKILCIREDIHPDLRWEQRLRFQRIPSVDEVQQHGGKLFRGRRLDCDLCRVGACCGREQCVRLKEGIVGEFVCWCIEVREKSRYGKGNGARARESGRIFWIFGGGGQVAGSSSLVGEDIVAGRFILGTQGVGLYDHATLCKSGAGVVVFPSRRLLDVPS